jgi:major vault protein
MAIDTRDQQNRDTTLPPDTYMYMQNIGKGGIITVFRGPFVVTQSGQDVPVKYDPKELKFLKAESLESAVQQNPRAKEGDYVVLENPTEGNKSPTESQQQAAQLKKGRKIIIPGPWSESLWPGQTAVVIEGHRLRSNQFLVATVYNAEEAEKNWDHTVAVTQTDTGVDDSALTPEQKAEKEKAKAANSQVAVSQKKGLPKPDSFAVGTRIVIKGSDVSFYIPCTGVEVLKDKDSKFVREAVTLEQLEYCCLVDENGKKEYPRGPKVVFPKPTQVFEEDKKGRRKFRPVELNTINGIHLKVTANFEDEDIEKSVGAEGKRPSRKYQEGEELFVTGKTLSIYYPREELAVIEYGQGNKKHFSTAVPKGEGRYIIDREKGNIGLIKGPMMLLPDPRNQILVRRILSQDECELWYPGNEAAKQYNAELSAIMADSPSGRSGVVSEGDVRKRQLQSNPSNFGGRRGLEAAPVGASFDSSDDYEPEELGETGGATPTVTRGRAHTTPRQLTLNTKFDGVPRVEVWPSYAVLILGSEGTRRVVQGPEVVLLEYDEKLGFMKLSTGKPKSTDKYFRTSYLCIHNNQVGDIIGFESKDHVKGTIKISLRVNFEGETEQDRLRWFSVDNYVKFLTDHVRSIIAGMAKKKTIAEIKANYVDIVRDAILGTKPVASEQSEPLRAARPGLFFESNGMRVVEVEVLEINLSDANIAKMLDTAQITIVKTNIEIDAATKELEATKTKEEIERQKASALDATLKYKRQLEKENIEEQVELLLKQLEVDLTKISNEKSKTEKSEEIADLKSASQLKRVKAETDHKNQVDTSLLALKKDELDASTTAAVNRFNAAKDGLYEVLVAMHRDDLAAKLAQGCTIERYLSGDSVDSSIANLLSISPMLTEFFNKAKGITDGGIGKNRLKTPEPVASR